MKPSQHNNNDVTAFPSQQQQPHQYFNQQAMQPQLAPIHPHSQQPVFGAHVMPHQPMMNVSKYGPPNASANQHQLLAQQQQQYLYNSNPGKTNYDFQN